MKRDIYTDIVKGICIICVIYVHINIIGKVDSILIRALTTIISHFFLTTFFVLSGFYLKDFDNPKKFIKTKIIKNYKKLLIYYIPFWALHNFFINIGFYKQGVLYNSHVVIWYDTKNYLLTFIKTILMMGSEPLLGALWFFVSLILALFGLIIIYSFVKKITTKEKRDIVMVLLLFIIMCISCIFTSFFNITIPRFSVALSVMILIYIGTIMNQKIKLKYDNIVIAIFCLFAFLINCLYVGTMQININLIYNPITFIVSSLTGVYILCFLAKKAEKNLIGKILSLVGKNSFNIMAFHLLAFKPAILLVNAIGIEHLANVSDLVPNTNNVVSIFLYLISGLLLPIAVSEMYNRLKTKINGKVSEK